MRSLSSLILASLVTVSVPATAQEQKPAQAPGQQAERAAARRGGNWTDKLTDRAKRGSLHDAFQNVRGDSGKWNDDPILQHAPPIGLKPPKMPLDDWADQLLDREFQVTSNDENWLLLRTRQLDDNDRVWVQQIERRGNQFTVVVEEAIWQGRYSKTFTYYGVFGVNLGKLDPGEYEVKCIIKPLTFKQFEGDGRPTDNWPKDERAADKKPTGLRTKVTVAGKDLSSG